MLMIFLPLGMLQFGATLRLPTWTFGEGRRTRRSSSIWTSREDSTMRLVSSFSPLFPSLVNMVTREQRWGDAPVHSIAASIFAKKEQIHLFESMGYEHNPYIHCPRKEEDWKRGRCSCDQRRSFGTCFRFLHLLEKSGLLMDRLNRL
jgi:hypothetical protein